MCQLAAFVPHWQHLGLACACEGDGAVNVSAIHFTAHDGRALMYATPRLSQIDAIAIGLVREHERIAYVRVRLGDVGGRVITGKQSHRITTAAPHATVAGHFIAHEGGAGAQTCTTCAARRIMEPMPTATGSMRRAGPLVDCAGGWDFIARETVKLCDATRAHVSIDGRAEPHPGCANLIGHIARRECLGHNAHACRIIALRYLHNLNHNAQAAVFGAHGGNPKRLTKA